jgi:hypothetical protein
MKKQNKNGCDGAKDYDLSDAAEPDRRENNI